MAELVVVAAARVAAAFRRHSFKGHARFIGAVGGTLPRGVQWALYGRACSCLVGHRAK